MVTSQFAVDVVIEMHTADAFHNEVDAYPAISVIRRQEQGRVLVASVGPEVDAVPSEILTAALRKERNGKKAVLPVGLRTARVDTWFKGSDPWRCHSPEQLALLRLWNDIERLDSTV